jgi:hypothetical protein
MGKVNPNRCSRQPPQSGAEIVVFGNRILGADDGKSRTQCDMLVHQEPNTRPSIELS